MSNMWQLNVFVLSFLAFDAFATHIDTSFLNYSDSEISQQNSAAAFNHEFECSDTNKFTVDLAASQKRIIQKDESTLAVREQYDGDPKLQITTFSFTPNYTIDKDSFGIAYARQQSRIQKTDSYGVNYSRWWNSDTLQTLVDFSRSLTSNEKEVLIYDRKLSSFQLPKKTTGNSVSLKLTHFTTPTTILIGSFAKIIQSDRPDAWTAAGEIRQHVAPILSSFHLSTNFFNNSDSIERETNYGPITASALQASWYFTPPFEKKLLIASLTHRRYSEIEKDSDLFPETKFSTRLNAAQLRFRFGEGPWAQNKPELTLTAGQYQKIYDRKDQVNGNYLGLGGYFVW